MSTDKMREEFEAWYFDRNMVVNRWDGLIYDDSDQQEAWRAWQASRAALVVELPSKISQHNTRPNGYVIPEAENYDEAIDDCRAAIEAAGIRTSLTR